MRWIEEKQRSNEVRKLGWGGVESRQLRVESEKETEAGETRSAQRKNAEKAEGWNAGGIGRLGR
jgi:hypothetical protein